MQLYLDSANPLEIKTACEWGVIDGVTTNLSLLGKAGSDIQASLNAVLDASPGPVYCQVVGWKEVAPLVAHAHAAQ